MRNSRILVVCQESEGLARLTSMLSSLGCPIEEANTDRAAVRLMSRNAIDLMLAVVDPDKPEALELLTYVHRKNAVAPVILMLTAVHPERAEEALRLGAWAVLKSPIRAAELRDSVLQALERCKVRPVGTPAQLPDSRAAACLSGRSLLPAHAQHRSSISGFSPSSVPTMAPATYGLLPEEPLMKVLGSGNLPLSLARGVTPLTRTQTKSPKMDLLTADPCLRRLVDLAGLLGSTSSSILIMGEAGTGKSLLARLLHQGGDRDDMPFVTLNCTDISEADPIGRETRTMATNTAIPPTDWAAMFAQILGGTLLVQEVGSLPIAGQLQLVRELRIHEEKVASGFCQSQGHLRLQFVLTTSEDLSALVEQGRFRPELYHMIGAISLTVPPLRLRGADIELLAEYFRFGFAAEFGKDVAGFSHCALDALRAHDWPGNVAELREAIKDALVLCDGPRITSQHLALILQGHRKSQWIGALLPVPVPPRRIPTLKEALEEPEKRIISQALLASNLNRATTAQVLDIHRTTLYKKMKKYNLSYE